MPTRDTDYYRFDFGRLTADERKLYNDINDGFSVYPALKRRLDSLVQTYRAMVATQLVVTDPDVSYQLWELNNEALNRTYTAMQELDKLRDALNLVLEKARKTDYPPENIPPNLGSLLVAVAIVMGGLIGVSVVASIAYYKVEAITAMADAEATLIRARTIANAWAEQVKKGGGVIPPYPTDPTKPKGSTVGDGVAAAASSISTVAILGIGAWLAFNFMKRRRT